MQQATRIRIQAPSRLHFGLLSLASGRRFGGCGVMVEDPGLTVLIQQAEAFFAVGEHSQRVETFARSWAEFNGKETPHVRIEVEKSPPQHVGLGLGTQLALAVAAGLNAWCDLAPASAIDLAQSVGRGLRSAVGVYGFLSGGFVVERGKQSGEPLSPLDCQVQLPEDWRFVLVRPDLPPGASGAGEHQAFADTPEPTEKHLNDLHDVLRNRLVPAAVNGCVEEFGAAVTQYGRLSGRMFAEAQGGDYNGPVLTACIERMLSAGARGVGQSSWGPTLFAVAESQSAANAFVQRFAAEDSTHVTITRVCNHGAKVTLS